MKRIPKPQSLIFLDIDGVMNTSSSALLHRTGEVFTSSAVAALEGLLAARPEARVVVSSTRRRAGLSAMQKLFRHNGLVMAAERMIDVTPILVTADVDDWREDEIEQWIDSHAFTGQFVVIDDKRLSGPLARQQVLTDADVGLTSSLARRAAEILGD